MAGSCAGRIYHRSGVPLLVCAATLALAAVTVPAVADSVDAEVDSVAAQRDRFRSAWIAARDGDRAAFENLGADLHGYRLYPYWQYEDYRHRKLQVPVAEMTAFLDAHEHWAFATALRQSWLRSLGRSGRWQPLREHGGGARSAQLRCYHARARLELGDLEGLVPEAQRLWTVGHSQDKACDPLFAWLLSEHGISRDLAWQRTRLAMRDGNPRLTLYLARFLPPHDRHWLERWQRLERDRYRSLARSAGWQDNEITRAITSISLERLARRDSAAAIEAFERLDPHFQWRPEVRQAAMHEIALMAAVDLEPKAIPFLRSLPADYVDDQLLQWWARAALAAGDWTEVRDALARLSEESRYDSRWRYWLARARLETGDAEAARLELERLSLETNFYAFLAADALRRPYTVCPVEPAVSERDVTALGQRDDFARALELRSVGLEDWAAAEWERAAGRLPPTELKTAAALAVREEWADRAIFALGNAGELRYYEWRFPVLWEEPVMRSAGDAGIDPAWVFGVMRSESAMTETARSSAGALGLMQLLPSTARDVARAHGLAWRSNGQLLEGEQNIRFGTLYLRELLDDYANNPVLVSGAYNAGPHVVDRWLKRRTTEPMRRDPALWVETLPYYETRDYIPRVLAFTTLYDWRLQNPVQRVSSRMPPIDGSAPARRDTTEVVCRPPVPELASGRAPPR